MQTTITGRHFEVTDALRQHIDTKIQKMERFLGGITDLHVVLSVEKHRHSAEITLLQANGNTLRSLEETHDMYESVDKVIEKIEKQARKLNRKRETSRKGRKSTKDLEVLVDDSEIPETGSAPKVIRSQKFAVKPMPVDEAAMQLGMAPDGFLVFLNSESDQINVMYKRKDGNYGLIEPEF
jgi:putative sigma-54 modulation protein